MPLRHVSMLCFALASLSGCAWFATDAVRYHDQTRQWTTAAAFTTADVRIITQREHPTLHLPVVCTEPNPDVAKALSTAAQATAKGTGYPMCATDPKPSPSPGKTTKKKTNDSEAKDEIGDASGKAASSVGVSTGAALALTRMNEDYLGLDYNLLHAILIACINEHDPTRVHYEQRECGENCASTNLWLDSLCEKIGPRLGMLLLDPKTLDKIMRDYGPIDLVPAPPANPTHAAGRKHPPSRHGA